MAIVRKNSSATPFRHGKKCPLFRGPALEQRGTVVLLRRRMTINIYPEEHPSTGGRYPEVWKRLQDVLHEKNRKFTGLFKTVTGSFP